MLNLKSLEATLHDSEGEEGAVRIVNANMLVEFVRAGDLNPEDTAKLVKGRHIQTKLPSSGSDNEWLESTALNYASYFLRLYEMMSKVNGRFNYLRDSNKTHLVCFDTDVVVGVLFDDVQDWAFVDPVFPDLAQAVGPSVLRYLLDASKEVYFPSGTIAELEYLSTRIANRSTRLVSKLGKLLSKNRPQTGQLAAVFGSLTLNQLENKLKDTLKALAKDSEQLQLLEVIRKKARPLAEIQAPDTETIERRNQLFDSALQALSSQRADVPVNNSCDAWNYAEVLAGAIGTSKESESLPILVTTTKAIIRLARGRFQADTPERAYPVVLPDEFTMFTDIACQFGWPNAGKAAYIRSADESGQLLKKTDLLRILSKRLYNEALRISKENSGQRQRIARNEVASLLDRIQGLYAEFLNERGSVISNYAELRRRDSLLWSQALQSTLDHYKKPHNWTKEKGAQLSEELSSQVARMLAEYDARSGLLALRHAFETARTDHITTRIEQPVRKRLSSSSLFKWGRVEDQTACLQEIFTDACKSIEIKDVTARHLYENSIRLACFMAMGDSLPLFTIEIEHEVTSNEVSLYIDLTYIPKLQPAEVWDIESELFLSQLHTKDLKRSINLTERAFKGDLLFANEHLDYDAGSSVPLFSKWEDITKRSDGTNAPPISIDSGKSELIRYADALTERLTFYIQNFVSDKQEYIAGLIVTPPIENKQISAFAKLLHLTNRFSLTEQIYEELLHELIDLLPKSHS